VRTTPAMCHSHAGTTTLRYTTDVVRATEREGELVVHEEVYGRGHLLSSVSEAWRMSPLLLTCGELASDRKLNQHVCHQHSHDEIAASTLSLKLHSHTHNHLIKHKYRGIYTVNYKNCSL